MGSSDMLSPLFKREFEFQNILMFISIGGSAK